MNQGVFCAYLDSDKLPMPEFEYQFAPPRKWRFDAAFVKQKVAIEVEGGVYIRGRHTRGAGYAKDCEKYSEAAARGWKIIRVLPDQLFTEQTLDWVRRALGATT